MSNSHPTIAIIGGGAAGFFAAANLAESCPEAHIDIYDTSSKFLSKVAISGGGRCNVTHNCFEVKKLVESYPRGSRELQGPFNRFQPVDTVEWFNQRGVPLVAEPDGRMFPSSNTSQSIIDCLLACVDRPNVRLLQKTGVKSIQRREDKFELTKADGTVSVADFVILATGSSHSGHALAASLGHSITECAPSLFTFKSGNALLLGCAGQSFKSASLQLEVGGKTFKQTGPLLITHWGLSGPAVLKLSAFAARELAGEGYHASLLINWIGGTKEDQCRESLQALKKTSPTKKVAANPLFSISRTFWDQLMNVCKIPAELNYSDLSKVQATAIATALTRSQVTVEGKGEFKEEFVTCGGVSLKEVDFRRMESKLVKNLFFAGEILDIDGITGGFNFQAAWTGGWLAAKAIAEVLN